MNGIVFYQGGDLLFEWEHPALPYENTWSKTSCRGVVHFIWKAYLGLDSLGPRTSDSA